MFTHSIQTFCQKHNIPLASIDLVGTHVSGLGLYGISETDDISKHPMGWNGNITAETGISTAFDFAVIEDGSTRPHASPMAFVDGLLLRHLTKFRACVNIGELVNCNFIPPSTDGKAKSATCCDCGPGSLLIDYAMRYCTSNGHNEDNDGKHATLGKVNQSIVTQFLKAYDYSRTLPSLTMAREMFGDHEAQRLIDECLFLKLSEADTVATVTRITAENILKQYHRLLALCFPPGQKVDELFISGPSARNANIIDYLEAELPESVITKPLDDIGISGDANEAVCYAHLALEAVLGQSNRSLASKSLPPLSLGHDVVLGRIVRGEGWDELLQRLLRFSDGEPLHLTRDVRVIGNLESGIQDLGLG
jgi:1,6-anhydro-N-acetylmuramate kinase